jgi:enoyl-CoA hydratase
LRSRRFTQWLSQRCHVAGPDIGTLTASTALGSPAILPTLLKESAAIRRSANKRKSTMTVRIEKNGSVWTVIHDRPEARNAMDPKSAEALTAAFLEFDADANASVAVFYGAGGAFCAGWDLKYVSTLNVEHPLGELDIPTAGPRVNGGEIPRGPMGPSRLELDKPVIAAIEGPAVAGGMELGLWCDFRVMAEDSYFGVYCRRWGVPLIDGGTVRLPRIVGQGRALEIILTGRKVPAQECLSIGLCEYVTPKGGARAKAEELAQQIARFPQVCVRADRRSAIRSHGLTVREALILEWYNGRRALIDDGVAGATRFKNGLGRHGDFERIR